MDRSVALKQILKKLSAIGELSTEERAEVATLLGTMRRVEKRRDIVQDGSSPNHSTLLVEGLACRYKLLANGERQILSFNVPGDIVDLYSFVLRKMDHAILSLSNCVICEIPHESIKKVAATHAHLLKLLWRDTLVDSSVFRTWMINNSRRLGEARAAHLFCEVYTKLQSVGLAEDDGFGLPISQVDLGDCLGMTPVHVNRVMKQLKDDGLLTMNKGYVRILDWKKLVAFASFDPGYLQLTEEAEAAVR